MMSLASCSEPEPETVYKDVPAPEPSAIEPIDDRTDPDVLSRYFVTTVADIDPNSQTDTTRINQMKNELVIHPAAEGCVAGPFTGQDMEVFSDSEVTLELEGDIEDVTDDPVDEPTMFAHAYQFTIRSSDSEGEVPGDILSSGEITLVAYVIAERNSEEDPFIITECAFLDGMGG